uniref:Uncharacterized protein n=1 Tax=Megaselia scalaris TaxID=36166 RepID=T1GB87_MEGSC
MKDAGVEPSVTSIMDSSVCHEATSALDTKSYVCGISSFPDEVTGASNDEDDEDGPTTQSLDLFHKIVAIGVVSPSSSEVSSCSVELLEIAAEEVMKRNISDSHSCELSSALPHEELLPSVFCPQETLPITNVNHERSSYVGKVSTYNLGVSSVPTEECGFIKDTINVTNVM